ncbi:MAG: 5'/3'-nucleotidase SurE [Planctomycetota bacterium]
MDILITNDDGPDSAGLIILADTLAVAGHRVRIVCPSRQKSGVGMQLTIYEPVGILQRAFGDSLEGYVVYGSPADCVKLAARAIYGGRKPLHEDFRPVLTVAGINPGANCSVNVLYSGTVAACLEALICDLPAIAVSVDLVPHTEPVSSSVARDDFQYAARFVSSLIDRFPDLILPRLSDGHRNLLNVNVPYHAETRVRGVKRCRQGFSRFNDWYEPHPSDSDGRLFYQLTGILEHDATVSEPDDATLLSDGWITLTLLDTSLTIETQRAVLTDAMLEKMEKITGRERCFKTDVR